MQDLTEVDFERATAMVSDWKRPLLLTHTKPDGDAIGSVLAMRALLRARGADPLGVLFGKIPARYAPLNTFEPLGSWSEEIASDEIDGCDGVIVLDTCSFSQLEPLAEWLRDTDKAILAVDHHKTRDDFASAHLIDESAAANCLILFEWACAAGWTITAPIATALFAGIAMDTGWFRHANTDARVFRAASELVSIGVSPSTMFDGLFSQDSAARVRLLSEAVSTLELVANDRIGVMRLTPASFDKVGALMSDAEDVVNVPLRIAGTLVSVLLVEQDDGVIRINLRSKPPEVVGGVDVDVAQIARGLGGGGHARAAGVRLSEPIDTALKRVLEAVMGQLPS